MCVNPIHIGNNSCHSVFKHPRVTVTVPCGTCYECLDKKSREWTFRCQQEYLACVKSGGYVYFETLSYNDYTLPHTSFDKEDPSLTINHFCYEDTRGFIKRLERILDRHGYHSSKSDETPRFRFFLVSEYGHTTHRPHYHVLFFVYCACPLLEFRRYVSDAWSISFPSNTDPDFISNLQKRYDVFKNRYWRDRFGKYHFAIGHIDNPGDPRTLLIGQCEKRDGKWVFVGPSADVSNSVFAINYIVKYLSKVDTWYNHLRSVIYRWRTGLKSALTLEPSATNLLYAEFLQDKKNRQLIDKIKPFHRQSSSFGITFLNELYENPGMDKAVLNSGDKGLSYISIPLYYLRKRFYTLHSFIDGTKSWHLNADGLKWMSKRLNRIVDNVSKSFEDFCKYVRSNASQYDADIYNLSRKLRAGSFELRDLACYIGIWRGRFVSPKVTDPLCLDVNSFFKANYNFDRLNGISIFDTCTKLSSLSRRRIAPLLDEDGSIVDFTSPHFGGYFAMYLPFWIAFNQYKSKINSEELELRKLKLKHA